MNRNTQERFALNPVNIDIQRSKFLMTPEVKTSFNVGDLIPLGMPIEVLPGDTFEISTAAAVRMQPLVSSPLDNLSFDFYWFFVPNRIVWDHWKEFMGENSESAWIPETEYTIPQARFYEGAVAYSVADYMGLPTRPSDSSLPNPMEDKIISVSALPFRGYALIYQDWFRNQNLIAPPMIFTDDTDRECPTPVDGSYEDPLISAGLGGHIFKVSKRPDYFTKALPGPQKSVDLTLMDHMPVYIDSNSINPYDSNRGLDGTSMYYQNSAGITSSGVIWTLNDGSRPRDVQPANWFVDSNLTISALRTAFQIQKLYEKDARGGTRYREQLKIHFGVTSPDASQQVPQYLGGRNIPININQVLQTSETSETPQGNVAGYSLTTFGSKKHDFIQSFTEHGYLFCLGAARIDQHTYQQGIHRSWSRKTRTQFYYPVLANISEQPILNKEIYAQGDSTDDQVFAYQEAWAEYRYMPSICNAQMRSSHVKSLDSWHFADDYNSLPSLSQSWIQEDKSNIDRTLAITSQVSNQLFGDFKFYIKATRPMPMYSIPGLIDHH